MKWNKESIWEDLEEGKVEVFIFIIISKIIEILKTEAKDLYFLLSTRYSPTNTIFSLFYWSKFTSFLSAIQNIQFKFQIDEE